MAVGVGEGTRADTARLRALQQYEILDAPLDPALDDLVRLAAESCGAPMALISMIDRDRQWFAAEVGVGLREAALESSICKTAIHEAMPFVVPDTRRDARFANMASVLGQPHVRAYAGAALETPAGVRLGMLCVLDRQPRVLTDRQLEMLQRLARQVMIVLELRATRRRLSNTVETITDALITLDHDLRVTYVNGPAERVLGRTRDHLVGNTLAAPSLVTGLKRALDSRRATAFEAHHAAADAWLDVRAHPSVDGLTVHLQDVTVRRRRDEELRVLETCVSRLDDCVLISEVTPGRAPSIVYVNDAFVRRTGYTRDEVLGKPHEAAARLRDAQAMERTHRAEVLSRTKAGEELWLEIEVAPVTDDAGRLTHWISIERDVTERKRVEQALRRSEQRYRQLFAHNPLPMWAYDLETLQFCAVNDAAIEHYGYSRDQFLGMTIADIRPPEDVAALREVVRACGGLGDSGVWNHRTADGRTIRVKISSHQMVLDGRRTRLVLAHDVTSQLAAEEALRASEERFRLMAKATNDAIWDLDLATGTLWWSDGITTLFGFDRADLAPDLASWTERIHPDECAAVVDSFHEAIDTGATSWSAEYRFLRKNGSYAYVLDRGHILRDPDDRAVRVVGGMTDLSGRKEAEEKLRDQATLLDCASDAILVRDLDGEVVYWNRGAEVLYGWSTDYACGALAEQLLYRDPAACRAATEATLAHGEWSGELDQVTREGRLVRVLGRWTLLRDEAGRPRSVLAINTDITERKQLEQQLLRAQRLESIGTLAGGIAHDLNNVLQPVLLGVEALREASSGADCAEDLEMIESCAQRGASMVRQLLSFARGSDGKKTTIELGTIGAELRQIIRDTFPKNIDLTLHAIPDLWSVCANATQLHQLLLNLCVNARDAMPDGGRLSVAFTNVVLDEVPAGARPGPYVLLEVADTGTGMPADILERIFDPFFTTKEVGKGTGLGLATSHAIVRDHGGFTRVYSTVGEGSSFEVYLPAVAQRPAADDVREALPSRPGSGQLVLVIDDEAPVRTVARRILERHGYRVLLASAGAEGVALFAEQPGQIAAVLLDLSMPGMDGCATAAALREIQPAVRLIGASGLPSPAFMSTVHQFIAKPFTAEMMLGAIAGVLAG